MRLSGQPTPGSVPSPSRAQSLSRADRRSLRAFAVAALACAALMGFSATAQAQTDVLSATLTVKDLGSSIVGCSNGIAGGYCSDFLADDEFTYDSTDYAIIGLFVRPSGSLEIFFDPDLTTATQTLTLDVAGTTFAFAGATTKPASARYWSNSGLSWTIGDPVVVKLTETVPTITDTTGGDVVAGVGGHVSARRDDRGDGDVQRGGGRERHGAGDAVVQPVHVHVPERPLCAGQRHDQTGL